MSRSLWVRTRLQSLEQIVRGAPYNSSSEMVSRIFLKRRTSGPTITVETKRNHSWETLIRLRLLVDDLRAVKWPVPRQWSEILSTCKKKTTTSTSEAPSPRSELLTGSSHQTPTSHRINIHHTVLHSCWKHRWLTSIGVKSTRSSPSQVWLNSA